jgi:ubiquinone/menaquinone biosynthesis C-methylase UbiE
MAQKDFREHVLYFYNRFAGLYDLTEFFRKGTRAAMLRVSGCKPGDRMLDVCTGTGELAITFARAGVRSVAVDLARGMLKIGRRKTNLEHLHFLETDATKLPFPDRAFDVMAISLALHHMPEPVQIDVLTEMKRLAAQKVILIEWNTIRNQGKGSWYLHLIHLMDESEHMREWLRQDFRATCHKAGLEIEHEETMTMGFHRITVCKPM